MELVNGASCLLAETKLSPDGYFTVAHACNMVYRPSAAANLPSNTSNHCCTISHVRQTSARLDPRCHDGPGNCINGTVQYAAAERPEASVGGLHADMQTGTPSPPGKPRWRASGWSLAWHWPCCYHGGAWSWRSRRILVQSGPGLACSQEGFQLVKKFRTGLVGLVRGGRPGRGAWHLLHRGKPRDRLADKCAARGRSVEV